MPTLRAWVDETIRRFPALLARFGIDDRRMGKEAFLLATPVMVTGGLRILLRLADFVMVGIALGGAVYAAILVDLYAKAAVNTIRFSSGRWQAVAREAGVGTPATD